MRALKILPSMVVAEAIEVNPDHLPVYPDVYVVLDPAGIGRVDDIFIPTDPQNPAGGGTFVSPARTIEGATAEKLAALAAHRYGIEVAGITIGGVFVKTDRESQSQLNSAFTSLTNGLIPDTPWKSSNGQFTEVTPEGITPVATATAQYVRACFKAEEIHTLAIQAIHTEALAAREADPSADLVPFITAIDLYDIATGWPPPPP
jgi:hypothetical protein